MMFNSNFTNPSPIFGCKESDLKFHPNPVSCIADLSLPPTSPIVANVRYLVTNTSSSDLAWGILPNGLEENDIIERDFQNLNWILKTDVSEVGAGILIYVTCEGYYYWYNGTSWIEINPSLRLESIVLSGEEETLDSLSVTTFNAVQWNLAVSYLDGTKRIFQAILATHEEGITPFHSLFSRVGSKISNFDYEVEVNISSGLLNLVIKNNSVNDYKIQVKRIPIENFND